MKLKLKVAGNIKIEGNTAKRFLVFELPDGSERKTMWWGNRANLLTKADVGCTIEVPDSNIIWGTQGWFRVMGKFKKIGGSSAGDMRLVEKIENFEIKVFRNRRYDPFNPAPNKYEFYKYNWLVKITVKGKEYITIKRSRRAVADLLEIPVSLLPDVEYENEWDLFFRILDSMSKWIVSSGLEVQMLVDKDKIVDVKIDIDAEELCDIVEKIQYRAYKKQPVIVGIRPILTDQEYIEMELRGEDLERYRTLRRIVTETLGRPDKELLLFVNDQEPPEIVEVLKRSGQKVPSIYVEVGQVSVFEELKYGSNTKIAVLNDRDILRIETVRHGESWEGKLHEILGGLKNWNAT